MGIQIIAQAVSETRKDIVPSVEKLLPDINAFWLIPDPVIMGNKDNLVELLETCDKEKVPVFSYHEALEKYGVTLIVSVDEPTIGRQAAGIALELLRGEKVGEKVQFPAGSHIILNLKKVSEYGLQYNENSLSAVNQIIG